eukprot:scaffold54999_cov46-Prasinocladus_malaysianus.AAC.1
MSVFAGEDIEAGTELLYDYGVDYLYDGQKPDWLWSCSCMYWHMPGAETKTHVAQANDSGNQQQTPKTFTNPSSVGKNKNRLTTSTATAAAGSSEADTTCKINLSLQMVTRQMPFSCFCMADAQ